MSDSRSPQTPVAAPASGNDDLLQKLLTANSLEQSGESERARALYEEIIAADDGFLGTSAQKALEGMMVASAAPASNGATAIAPTPETESGSGVSGLWQRSGRWVRRWWEDLSFAGKLTMILVSGAVVPVAIVTGFLVEQTRQSVEDKFRADLESVGASWTDDYVVWTEDDSQTEAENLTRLVQVRGINPSNPQQVAAERTYLEALVTEALAAGDRNRADVTKSFRIITDANGRTIVQGIKIHTSALTGTPYPPVPESDREITPEGEFTRVDVPPGIDLGDLEIVKTALETGQPLRGLEIVPGGVMERLGLAQQAAIPLRPGETSGIARPYDLDEYRAGLATVVVYPITLPNGQIGGTAIVGVLHNRHFALLDTFQQLVDLNSISVYAYDWRVNTNVPTADGTRAIGTLAPPDVAREVLEQGEQGSFTRETVSGVEYLAYYRPIDNHNEETIGMVAVGRPLTELQDLVSEQFWLALQIGIVVLLVAMVLAFLVAKAFSGPLRRLADFAEQVGAGQTGVRLAKTTRADEIGILSQELNQMVVSIEANIDAVKQQEEMRRKEAQQQRREKERLQRGVVNLLLEIEGAQRGDLTVNAPVTEGSVGSIADAFNTTIRRLRDLVLQVRSGADQVNDLSKGSAPSMQQVSREASIQAREINRTLMTVAQINESIREVDRSAQQAASIAQAGTKAAKEGGEIMDLTVSSIDKIRNAVDETASKVNRLTESFKQILQILTIISSISERTNLLAYNASIEASRAGEGGEGFRVVAEEVRRLAGRATEATRSIGQIVETIQKDTEEVQRAMETGKSEVAEGAELVDKTKQTLQGLAEISQKIDQYLQSISQNTTSQAEASEQVNLMVEEVSKITQNTSEQAQGVAESLQELVKVANSLQASVSQFRLEK